MVLWISAHIELHVIITAVKLRRVLTMPEILCCTPFVGLPIPTTTSSYVLEAAEMDLFSITVVLSFEMP